ncbi:MAG TPA: lipopolysaccharide biosynthesis protein [Allosphingosinicella sp.]|jgi:O-antigen/teichoic acid export membrane protein|nr:lipopolysaccharide biosynthesis protein [Allosphingosinicella sp.]
MNERNRAGRLIVRGTASSGLGFAIRFGARFLFLFVAGRLFGAALFGAYSIGTATVETAAIAGGLSTKWLLFKWLNENEAEGDRLPIHVVLEAALLVLAASMAVALLVFGLAAAAPQHNDSMGNTGTAVLLLAPMIPLQALIEFLLGATRWREVMRYEVVAKNVMQPYAGIVVALGAWWLGWKQEGLILSYIAGTVASLAYSVYGVRRCFGGFALRRFRPDLRRIGRHFRASLPSTGIDLIDALATRLDIYVVGALLGETAAGIYGMARQLSLPIRQARQAFDGMLVPVVARTYTEAGATSTGRSTASAARLILLVQLVGVIVLTAIGLPLLHALGKRFFLGYGALLCLVAAELIQGAFGVSELILIYSRPRVAAAMTTAFMIVAVGGAILLEPRFGLTGIAFAILLSTAARALCRRLLLRHFHEVEIPASYWTAPLAAAAAGLAIAEALIWSFGSGRGFAIAIPAALAGLAVYGLALLTWVRISGENLLPQGFVSGGSRDAAEAPAQ